MVCLVAALSGQNKHEVRAVWLTTIGGIDWPRSYAHDGMGIRQQQEQLCHILDRLKAVNVNTVLLQTRVRATTIYPSDIEPWDGCLSGKPGKSPGYDALQYAIDECHKRGMELHAWVVTIPVGKWNTYGCQQLRRRYGSLIKHIGEEGYMDPESSQTADYIARMCEEMTRRYDIDGIHLDYIRYPETWKGRKSPEYITRIVEAIHQRVKSYKPWVKLSCSPIGKYDDLKRYPSRGWNARRTVAQDAQGWLRQGLMDQLYPMMYFQGNNFYPFAIDWQEHSYGRTIVSGLGIYMLHPHEGKWQMDEVQRQLNVTRQVGLGHCYFRAKFLLDNVKGVYDYVRDYDRHPALIPPMTWAQQQVPDAPTTLQVTRTTQGDMLTWGGARDRSNGPYLLYNIYASREKPVDINNPANLIATRYLWQQLTIPRQGIKSHPLHYAVTATDRYGNESKPAFSYATGHEEHPVPSAPTMLPYSNGVVTLNGTDASAGKLMIVTSAYGNDICSAIVSRYAGNTTIRTGKLSAGLYKVYTIYKKGHRHLLGYFAVNVDN